MVILGCWLKYLQDYSERILSGIREAVDGLDPHQVEGVLGSLLQVRAEGRKILVVGLGRSGLVGRAFAMRIMNLGFNIYVMGETITPAIGKGDLVLIISGSGTTPVAVNVGKMAKRLGVRVIAVTSYPDSPLGRLADQLMQVSGRGIRYHEDDYNARQIMGDHEPFTPLGTIFEESTLVILDCIITELMERMGIRDEEREMT
jgi:6-phospho-3-hexuloisomerase